MVERREAFHPRPAPTPRPAVVEAGQRPKLWVIGIDSATLDAILPLAGQGRLPFLATVLQNGAYGRLSSIVPTRRDALWTTLATGKYPFKHGITGRRSYPAPFLAPGAELRLLPTGISFQRWGVLGARPLPAGTPRREALALWEILPRLGVPAGVVGWPAGPTRDRRSRSRTASSPASRSQGAPALAERAGSRCAGPRGGRTGPARRSVISSPACAGTLPRTSEAVFLLLPGLREVSRRWFGGFNAVQFEGGREAERGPRRGRSGGRLLRGGSTASWRRPGHRRRGPAAAGGGLRLRGRAPGVAEAADGAGNGARRRVPGGAGRRPAPLRRGDPPRGPAHRRPAGRRGAHAALRPGLSRSRATSTARCSPPAFDKSFLARNPLTVFPSYEGLARAARS